MFNPKRWNWIKATRTAVKSARQNRRKYRPSIEWLEDRLVPTALVVTGLTPTSTGFVATFNKPFNLGANQPLRLGRHSSYR